MDVVLSIPFLLFAIALASVCRPEPLAGHRRSSCVLVFSWAAVGRIVRGQVISIREKEYIEAARALGAGPGGSCSSTCCRT